MFISQLCFFWFIHFSLISRNFIVTVKSFFYYFLYSLSGIDFTSKGFSLCRFLNLFEFSICACYPSGKSLLLLSLLFSALHYSTRPHPTRPYPSLLYTTVLGPSRQLYLTLLYLIYSSPFLPFFLLCHLFSLFFVFIVTTLLLFNQEEVMIFLLKREAYIIRKGWSGKYPV